ncbi:hypothetical protein RJ640_016110 [Escallonia rubra]|uniref:Trichome birefringence-like N-terminal domain-containing protein n=1 Tax=Escallonia rubra TaxID=112253 RepID=A0AA88QWD0_9ASTE|nr:hypothetical protein RJ640_016110 [Escallonia rubra]
MVSLISSSSMDLRKLGLSDYCVSPRRKVLSGFGLGLLASLIVLSVVLINVSFKAPFLNPMFQGFNSLGSSNNSTFYSGWSFSFSRTTGFSSVASSDTDASSVTAAKLEDYRKIHDGNVSEIGASGKIGNDTGMGMDLEGTHLGNFSEVDWGSSKNVSFLGKAVGSANNSGFEKVKVSSDINVGNVTYNGGNVGWPSKKERVIERSHAGNFSGKDNLTVSSNVKLGNGSLGDCDIFDGRWVRDDTKPYYPGGSCPYVDRDFDCHLNGRPDEEFVKWKWQPYGCDIPSLNATDFLERLRGKKLVFVGDSLNRNMWESLVCILRQGVEDKKRDYNCTVDFVSSPFLVRQSSFNGRNGSFETLRLDLMDLTTSMYHDADVLVFNTGHWWTHEKTSRGEDYYQEGDHVHPRLKVLEAYTRALRTWARWIDKNIDGNRTQVIFRGYSVTHFRGGQWNSGGQCHKETEPIFNNTHLAKYPSKMRVLDYVLEEMRTSPIYLNISRLTDYRKDGHPSIYRMEYKTVEEQIAAERSQDCSHWCLPGVPDTWNELLYASLMKAGRGSWGS